MTRGEHVPELELESELDELLELDESLATLICAGGGWFWGDKKIILERG